MNLESNFAKNNNNNDSHTIIIIIIDYIESNNPTTIKTKTKRSFGSYNNFEENFVLYI